MAPVTRRSTSGGISKAPLRKAKTRDDNFSGSGVGLATSALRADADAALQSRPESTLGSFAVKPLFPDFSGNPTTNGVNGVNGTNGVHHALQPLSKMADRVGREVEDFAEKIDRWRTKLTKAGSDASQKYKATMALVDQLKDIAKARVDHYWKMRDDTLGRPSGRTSSWDSGLRGLRAEELMVMIGEAQLELDTWRLFEIMLRQDYKDPSRDPVKGRAAYKAHLGDITPYSDGEQLFSHFLYDNHLASEQHQVLHWLEESAEEHGLSVDEILVRMEDKCGRESSAFDKNWLHTRTKLKAEKRSRSMIDAMDPYSLGSNDANGIVSQLDPDAPTRQSRKLADKDTDQEKAWCAASFEMLRAGQGAMLADYNTDRGEYWRTLSLGLVGSGESGRTYCDGPDYGILWRKVCYAVARKNTTPSYERALYGLRAGDLPTSLEQCMTWDDHLYAYYNSLILSHWESYVREKLPHALDGIDDVAFPSPTALTALGDGYVGASVVTALKANEKTRAEAVTPMKQIQGALLSRQFVVLAMAAGLAASDNLYIRRLETSHAMPPRKIEVEPSYGAVFKNETALRLCVHMGMIMEAVKSDGDENARWRPLDRLMVCYLDFLRRAGKFETLPTYAVYMHPDLADKVLGMMLTDIEDVDEQRTLINLIDRTGMKAVEALFEQVHFALEAANLSERPKDPVEVYQLVEKTDLPPWPGLRMCASHLPVQPTAEERKVIRAAEWYTLVHGQLYGILDVLAVVYRSFLVHGRWSAALALTEQVSYKALLALKTPYYYGKIVDFMDENPPVPETLPEDTFRRTTRASSRQPELSIDNGWGGESRGDPERVTLFHKLFKRQGQSYYELMQLTLALKALSDWRNAEARALNDARHGQRPRSDARKDLQNALDVVSAAVEPVLHGFLTTARHADEHADLVAIRRIYLPETVLAYVSVLHFAATYLGREYFTRALDLAGLVASEGNKELQEAFVNVGKMEELVKTLANVSRQLLRENEQKAEKKGDVGSRKRGWDGRTVDIWDVARLN